MPNKLLKSPRRLLTAPKIQVRARKVRPGIIELVPDVVPIWIDGKMMNKPETIIYMALNELRIDNVPQFSILGGDILGGARMDFYLPRYEIDLEYNGPFHATSYGNARDALRNIGPASKGIRVEKIYETDLPRIKKRLLQIVGKII